MNSVQAKDILEGLDKYKSSMNMAGLLIAIRGNKRLNL